MVSSPHIPANIRNASRQGRRGQAQPSTALTVVVKAVEKETMRGGDPWSTQDLVPKAVFTVIVKAAEETDSASSSCFLPNPYW